jgi:hypothetical protein
MNNEHFDRINKILEPYRRIQESIEPFMKIQRINERFEEIRKPLERLDKIHSKIAIFNNPLHEQLQKINSIHEKTNEFFKKTPKYLLLLAEYGWYLDFDTNIDLPIRLGIKIKKNDIESVDEYLIDYYRRNFDKIIISLSTKHPDRKEVFEQISIAHKQGLYSVSIPSIFSQVDGVCYDFTEKLFFIKNKAKEKNKYLPQISNEITNISNIALESFLSPIYNQTPIIAHESILNEFPVRLNRHLIMHGIEKEYGNEKNSLKCLSLLKYLSDILEKVYHPDSIN